MSWIEFTEDYNWWLPNSTKPFKAGMVVFAPRALAKLAVEAGKAKKIKRPIGAVDDDEQEPA